MVRLHRKPNVNDETLARLEQHRRDFEEVTGKAFQHFYCPLLFRDEPVALSQGHILNEAFPDSDRSWVVQRTDIDSFYGSVFESAFVQIQHRGKRAGMDYFTDKDLSRHIAPRIFVEGRPIEHYRPTGPIPVHHSEVFIESDEGQALRIALKIDPKDLASVDPKDFQISVSADLRLPAVGALLKAAHLTLFRLLGYRWPLSAAGRLLGYDILGKFFLENCHLRRPEVLENARLYFREFAALVRPVNKGAFTKLGTLTDGYHYMCLSGAGRPWAIVIIVRTGEQYHAVLVPAGEDVETSVRYLNFIKSPTPSIELRVGQYRDNAWYIDKSSIVLPWPEVESF